jgi:hypothetical protein
MQDQWYATLGAARRAPASSLPERLRSGLLRGLIVCPAFPLASCRQEGVLDPQGPIASAQRLIVINATEIMPVVALTRGFALISKNSES